MLSLQSILRYFREIRLQSPSLHPPPLPFLPQISSTRSFLAPSLKNLLRRPCLQKTYKFVIVY